MATPSGNRRKDSDKKVRSEKKSTGRTGSADKQSSGRPKPLSESDPASKRGKRGSSRNESRFKPAPDSEKKAAPRRSPKPWEKEGDDRPKRFERPGEKFGTRGKFYRKTEEAVPKRDDGLIRLNRYLSNAGIASRREADKLIELGLVQVNGKVVTELGLRVDPYKDVVKYDDRSLKPEKQQYVLLNKPKDYLTTNDDPEERKTVMHLIQGACKERIYPVGRLDRHTTGLLLFTNDGDMAKRLTSPKNGFPKIYHVETIEKIKGEHIDAIREGVKLEEGFIKADEISLVNGDPRQVGIKLNTSKDKVIRSLFEHFKYTVKKLDRVMYGSLTKRDLARGRYRNLTEQEINFLRMIR